MVVKLVNEEAVSTQEQQEETPLTASWESVPEGRNGETPFALRIAFSGAISISYRTLRDHSLEVTGGGVAEARHVDGRSDLWEITVEPDSEANVSILLPVTTDCADRGAVCAGSDKPLSGGLALLIPFSSALQDPPQNSSATGAPAIAGTPQVGDVAYSYQWVANDRTTDTDISGATNSTYTPVEADEGKTIKVRVSFTDDAGNQESLTSEPTEVLAAKP